MAEGREGVFRVCCSYKNPLIDVNTSSQLNFRRRVERMVVVRVEEQP